MEPKEGEIYKSTLDGAKFIVKKVINSMVILESQDGTSKILTGADTLGIRSFYEKQEETK